MIRKKIIVTELVFLSTNIKTYETKEISLQILGKSSQRKIKKAIADFDVPDIKLVQLISEDELCETREMDLKTFIKNSKKVED